MLHLTRTDRLRQPSREQKSENPQTLNIQLISGKNLQSDSMGEKLFLTKNLENMDIYMKKNPYFIPYWKVDWILHEEGG